MRSTRLRNLCFAMCVSLVSASAMSQDGVSRVFGR